MVQSSRVALFFVVAVSACGGSDPAAGPAAPAPLGATTPSTTAAAPPPAVPPIVSTVSPPVSATGDPAACPAAAGRVLTVGPGKQYATVRAAAAAAQSGDTIHISAGDYRGDVATWRASNVTICGIGGRARLLADGVHEGGKGIWVIQGSDTTVINVEFHGAKVPDQNGAGIRQEGRNLTLRSTGFFDNENGILTDSDSGSTITIESSEFARNGFGDGYTHGVYIGNINRLNVRASFFHEAKIGHNLKSRAKENFVENSYFMDGPAGTSSYLLDFPDGGVVFMRGNLLHKGPNADNTTSVAYGMERNTYAANTVTLVHNTLASTLGRGTFVAVAGYTQTLTLTANLFAGTGTMASGVTGTRLVQQNNFATAVSSVTGPDIIASPNFWPVATALPQLQLANIPDPQYAYDSPQPYALRSVAVLGARMIGALQSAP